MGATVGPCATAGEEVKRNCEAERGAKEHNTPNCGGQQGPTRPTRNNIVCARLGACVRCGGACACVGDGDGKGSQEARAHHVDTLKGEKGVELCCGCVDGRQRKHQGKTDPVSTRTTNEDRTSTKPRDVQGVDMVGDGG